MSRKTSAALSPVLLFSIDERLVLRDMERIGGRHVENVVVQELVVVCLSRRCNCRLECAHVSESGRTAVKPKQLVIMQFKHLQYRQKERIPFAGHFASFLKVRSWEARVRACARAILRSREPAVRIGVMISRSPSVETSSSVSAVIRSSSRTGLSMMMPELFPTA